MPVQLLVLHLARLVGVDPTPIRRVDDYELIRGGIVRDRGRGPLLNGRPRDSSAFQRSVRGRALAVDAGNPLRVAQEKRLSLRKGWPQFEEIIAMTKNSTD